MFVFDRETKLDRTTGLSLDDVAKYDWTDKYKMGSVGVDWVMYNPNYDVVIYCAMEFHYSANGAFNLLFRAEQIYDTTEMWEV